MAVDDYVQICTDLARDVRIGVAPHSLRAVTPDELDDVVALAQRSAHQSTSTSPSR